MWTCRKIPVLLTLIVCFCGLGLSSCRTVSNSPPDRNQAAKEESARAIRKVFETVNQATVNGDLATAYAALSNRIKQNFSMDDFRQSYEEMKETWIQHIRHASIDYISVDETLGAASALVHWGTGAETVVEFVRENGQWKEATTYPVPQNP